MILPRHRNPIPPAVPRAARGFRPPPLAVAALAVVALVAAAVGCGKVDEDDLRLWSGSEAGFEKMEEFVADVGNDTALRLRALELLVEGRFARRARTMVEKAPDRDTLAAALVERLLPRLTAGSDAAADGTAAAGEDALAQQSAVKDTLLLLLVLVPDEKKEAIREAVAAWAFDGIPDDASSEQVRAHIEARLRLGQITDLGPHGVQGAATLIAHGFGVEKLYTYLRELDDPAVDLRILRAFEKLHATPDIDIPPHHLAKIQALETPEAAVYLLRLYMRDDLPRDIRGDAFGLAIRAFKTPEVKKAGEKLLPDLYRILQAGENDDRRLAAHYVLRFGGVAELERVLDAFEDDGTFNATVYETLRFARDICRDDVIKLRGDPVPALVASLEDESAVTKLLALVCLKLSGRVDALAKLEGLLEDETPMGHLVGEERTLGQLAQNAVDGMKAVAELTKKRDAGKLTEDRYEIYRKLYEDELLLTGADLDRAVRKTARAQLRKLKKGEDLP